MAIRALVTQVANTSAAIVIFQLAHNGLASSHKNSGLFYHETSYKPA